MRARATLAVAHAVGADVLIPAVVIAETVRGAATDASVNRIIEAIDEIIPTDETVGRTAGGLLGAIGSNSTIDALVIASTIRLGGGVVLTGDSRDLAALADGHPAVRIQAL